MVPEETLGCSITLIIFLSLQHTFCFPALQQPRSSAGSSTARVVGAIIQSFQKTKRFLAMHTGTHAAGTARPGRAAALPGYLDQPCGVVSDGRASTQCWWTAPPALTL